MKENSLENGGKDRIESLEEKLYSRSDSVVSHGRRVLPDASVNAPTEWGEKGDESETNLDFYYEQERNKQNPVLKWLLIGAAVFFLGSAGFAGYMFFGGGNSITGDSVNIMITGPVSVPGGEELPLDIVIDNQNPTSLSGVSLAIDYPPGTRKPGDLRTDFSRYQESIGSMNSGESIKRHVSAVLFGEANSVSSVKVSVEYRVPGSSALFLKQKDYAITISSAPISVVVDAPQDVVSGQPFNFSVTVSSNSSTVIQNLAMKAEYGFGFTFINSDPATSLGTDTWKIGDLKPGDKRTIKIRGKIDGQNDEQRAFRFSVGTADPVNPRNIQTVYISSTNIVSIQKPYVGVTISINGDSSKSSYDVSAGSNIGAVLNWNNNSPVVVTNLEVDATISGQSFDRSSVSTGGYYRSLDNTIVWDKGFDGNFISVPPAANGSLSFAFSSLDLASLISRGIGNPRIDLKVKSRGVHPSDGGNSSFENDVAATIKINSVMALNQKLTYYDGPFANTGPLPPRPDTETTYTVTWSLTNAVNSASNVVVSGRLSPYVKFLGVVSPQGENVTFNPLDSSVTWNAGRVSAFAGFSAPVREVSFQIGFLPSVTQSGQSPILLNQVSATGVDDYTAVALKSVADALTSILEKDPRAKQGDWAVSR